MSGGISRTQKIRSKEAQGDLSPEEFFLLSRLQTVMTVGALLELCPWAEDESLKLLNSLMQKKIVELVDSSNEPPEVKRQLDEEEKAFKDLSRSFRLEVLLKFQAIDNEDPFECFGLAGNSSEKQIKDRYLILSKKFHPDRFFSKDLGHYKQKLEYVFSKIQKAYALLRDPYEREALSKQMALKKKTANPSTKTEKRKLHIDPQMEKIFRAEKYYKAGLEQKEAGDFVGAANNFTLAYQINPDRDIYKKEYDNLQPQMVKQRSGQQIDLADKAFRAGNKEEALSLSEQALRQDPHSSDAMLLIGKCILDLQLDQRYRDAKEMLLRAKAARPKDSEACVHLGRAWHLLGDKKTARKEWEEALKRNPQSTSAAKFLEDL